MEKSIEATWKETFLKNDKLIAPKVNNLYKNKSIDFVEKFKKKFKEYIITLIAFSFLPVLFFERLPYTTIMLFVLLNTIAFIYYNLIKDLEAIDYTNSSYDYVNSFKSWTDKLLSVTNKMSRYTYVFAFFSFVIGAWFGRFGGDIPGINFIDKFIAEHPNTYLVFGFPLIFLTGIVIIPVLLSVFGKYIGKSDLNIAFGSLFKKLDELVFDLNELKTNEN